MQKSDVTHVLSTEDREIQFNFTGPVPRVGEVVQVGGRILLVKCVRWQSSVIKEAPDPTQSETRSFIATLTCKDLSAKGLDGYSFQFEFDEENTGHLLPDWWQPFIK